MNSGQGYVPVTAQDNRHEPVQVSNVVEPFVRIQAMPRASNNLKSLESFASVATTFCECIDSLRDRKPSDLYARLEILLQQLHQRILPVRAQIAKRKVRSSPMAIEQWREMALVIRDAVGPEILALRRRHFPTQAEVKDEEASQIKEGGAVAELAGTWRQFREWLGKQNVGRDDADRALRLWVDLADIYRELQAGLTLWKRKSANAKAEASWEWRYGYAIHWGHHLFSAMLTVYEIRYDLSQDEDFIVEQ